jgi:hypothetical protein
MKKLTLAPEQVLATDTSFPEDDLAFQIYYRVFAKGGGVSLPPIIVGSIKSPSDWIARLEIGYSHREHRDPDLVRQRRREYRILFSKLREIPYYILDGNHRALASALSRQSLNALYLESDADLLEVERMVSTGDLLSFPHEAGSLEELEGQSIQHFLKLNDLPPNHALNASNKIDLTPLVSVATRAYDLCSSNRLPRYMVKNYTARKEGRPRILPN